MNKRGINSDKMVTFEELPKEQRWSACIDSLQGDFTLTLRQMCQFLKVDRSWLNRYVKPHLRYIYLSNGVGKSANYLEAYNLVRYMNDQNLVTDTTWYSLSDFESLLNQCFVDITRQTIAVSIDRLILPEKLRYFNQNYRNPHDIWLSMFDNGHDYKQEMREHENLIRECASEEGWKMYKNRPLKYKRTLCQAVPYQLDKSVMELELKSAHDMKDYGDTDEEVYRKIFQEGYCRAVLRIPDRNNVFSEKVYYFLPEAKEFYAHESVTLSYYDFLKNQNFLNNMV